jgi:hypothetical protein
MLSPDTTHLTYVQKVFILEQYFDCKSKFLLNACNSSQVTCSRKNASVGYVSGDSSLALHDEDSGDTGTGVPCHTPVSHDCKGTSSNDNFSHIFYIQIPHFEDDA